jgi:hypothetical protein
LGLTDLDETLDVNYQPCFVTVWGDGTLDELQEIIDHYRSLGFNKVWHGHENSTLCIEKSEKIK